MRRGLVALGNTDGDLVPVMISERKLRPQMSAFGGKADMT
jgi:hypothetical protein